MQPWKGAQQQIAFIKTTPRDCLRDQKTTTKKKKRVHAESVCDYAWIKANGKLGAATTWRRPTFSLHHCHLFITLTYSWYLYGTIFFPIAAWWGCDCSHSFKFFKDKQAYKSCSSYPHWQCNTFKFMLPLFLEKSHTALCQIAVPPQILWSNSFGSGWDEEAGLWFLHQPLGIPPFPFTFKKMGRCMMTVWRHYDGHLRYVGAGVPSYLSENIKLL